MEAIDMRETRTLEFKETITNTFLKTVSAFSNYDGGIILFGVDDDGNIKLALHLTNLLYFHHHPHQKEPLHHHNLKKHSLFLKKYS